MEADGSWQPEGIRKTLQQKRPTQSISSAPPAPTLRHHETESITIEISAVNAARASKSRTSHYPWMDCSLTLQRNPTSSRGQLRPQKSKPLIIPAEPSQSSQKPQKRSLNWPLIPSSPKGFLTTILIIQSAKPSFSFLNYM